MNDIMVRDQIYIDAETLTAFLTLQKQFIWTYW